MKKSFRKFRNPDGSVSVRPVPTVEQLKAYYTDAYYQRPQSSSYRTRYPSWEIRHRQHKADTLMHAIMSVKKPTRRAKNFIDLGCGEGFVLNAASTRGFRVTGIDFSDFAIRKFHPGLLSSVRAGDVMEGLDELHAAGEKFSFVTAINVLEHVIDPALFLARLKRIVTPDAVIALTVPNDYSRLQRRLKELKLIDRDYWFCPPDHLHYFNTSNIRTFLRKSGFAVVDAYSDFPIDLYLFHPGSNYVLTSEAGPPAHRARIEVDLMLAENGASNYLELCRAMTKCGLGRDFTIICRLATRSRARK